MHVVIYERVDEDHLARRLQFDSGEHMHDRVVLVSVAAIYGGDWHPDRPWERAAWEGWHSAVGRPLAAGDVVAIDRGMEPGPACYLRTADGWDALEGWRPPDWGLEYPPEATSTVEGSDAWKDVR